MASDFRLTDANSGRIVTDYSAKVVMLTEENYSVIVTYCGIGRWKGKETSRWIKDWLKHDPSEQPTFLELAETLKYEGNRWLRRIGGYGKYRHSFILCGISRDNTQLALISNYDTLTSAPKSRIEPQLGLEINSVRGERLLITGNPRSVTRENRRLLAAVTRRGADDRQIQRVMAKIIADAARTGEAKGTISPACYTYSLNQTLDGRGRTHGNARGPVQVVSLNHGQDHLDLIRNFIGPNAQVVLMGTATVHVAHPKKPEVCHPEIVPQVAPQYELIDLPQLGGGSASAISATSDGHIVGHGVAEVNGPLHALVWTPEAECHDLIPERPIQWARDINEKGHIVGTLNIEGGRNRAFLLKNGQLEVLPTLGGIHSNGHAVSNNDQVVGASWTIPGAEPGDKLEHAFLWSATAGMQDLGVLPGHQKSRATDINDKGYIIGFSMPGGFLGSSRAVIWAPNGNIFDLGTLGGAGATAVSINNSNLVVGFAHDLNGESRSFIWSPESGTRALLLPEGGIVTSVNDHGDIVYNLETGTGRRSFLVRADGSEEALPYFKDHETEAVHITNSGLIVGSCTKGQHGHAVLWRPTGDTQGNIG